MKERNEIQDKYKWDLTRFYKTNKEIDLDIEKLKQINEQIVSQKGNLHTSDAIFLYFKLCEEETVVSEKLGAYSMLCLSLDGADKDALALSSKLSMLDTELAKKTAFVPFELAGNSDEFYASLKKEPRFADYDRDIDDIVREKPHTLSEEKEKLLAGVSEFCNQEDVFDAMDNVDFKFDDIVMPDGAKEKLTNANYSIFISSENRDVRRQAYENIHKEFKEHNMCLSTNFISDLKSAHFFATEHNFDGVKQSKFFNSEMPENVIDVLVENVNNNLDLYHKYFNLKKQGLKQKEFFAYDNRAPLVESVNIKPTYDESFEIFKKVVAPLGEKYINYATEQVENRYVDVFETKNKNSGAFNAGFRICNPYVLLNYKENLNGLSTLCHEFGHMVNSCFINDNQPLVKRECSIFTAEIASTVNECLLFDYLLENAKDVKEKIYLLDKFLNNFNATVFRQTMFTEFEEFAHKSIKEKVPITYDDLNEFYGDLQKKYFGKDVILPECSKYEWSRVPHFYSPFYVYSYATGFLSACIIANKIETEEKPFVDKYLEFLSSGTSDSGINILKKLGIDICTNEVYEQGFALYNEKLKELKTLLEETC